MLEQIVEEIKTKSSKAVVSLSGGLDSTTLTYLLVEALGKENVAAISFDYNQRHDIELDMARKTTEKLGIKHKVLDVSFLGDLVSNVSAMVKGDIATPTVDDILGDPQPVTYVPYRNLILSSLVASYCEAIDFDSVAMGIQAIDSYSYWDTTPDFAEAINNVFSLNRKAEMSVITPFVSLTKVEEIMLGKKLGVSYEDTWTCYNPQGNLACGVCPSCAERLKSFEEAGIEDPIKYVEFVDE